MICQVLDYGEGKSVVETLVSNQAQTSEEDRESFGVYLGKVRY